MSLANKVNFSSTNPAAPPGKRNIKPQNDGGSPTVAQSFYVPEAWGSIATKSGSYTAVQADGGKFLPCNGTFTVDLDTHDSPIVPNLDADWEIYILNIGSGTVTVDGNGCEINGSSSLSLASGEAVLIRLTNDGSSFLAFQGAASGGGGGSDSWAVNEVVSGSGNSWTLAHTPIAGSLMLEQYLPGFGAVDLWEEAGSPVVGDYTISGDSITTANSIAANHLRAWYRY